MTIYLKRIDAPPKRDTEWISEAKHDNQPDIDALSQDVGCIENDLRSEEKNIRHLKDPEDPQPTKHTVSKSREVFNKLCSMLNMFQNIEIQSPKLYGIPLTSAKRYGQKVSKPKLKPVKTKPPKIKRQTIKKTRVKKPGDIIRQHTLNKSKLNFKGIKKTYCKR